MPRRREVPKRKVLPDPLYNDQLVTKFMNRVMLDGKKAIAEKIVYGAFDIIHERTREEPLKVFHKALENAQPMVEVKSRRVGGANYQVPMMVNRERGRTLALRWLVQSARDRKEGAPMNIKLSKEMIETLDGKSSALMKKETQDKMANANRANANLARRDQVKKDKPE